jgi:hypothetical protein
MVLYHFTCVEFLKSIMREGLCRGDVRTKQIGPLFETNAVWLTTNSQPKGHGLGLPGTLTEEDRLRHFKVFGTMPPQESVIRTKALFESLWTSPKKILACGGGLVGHASIASRASMITWCAQTVAVTRRGGCTSARSRPISSAISTWIHRSGMHILAEHLTGKSPTLLSTRR